MIELEKTPRKEDAALELQLTTQGHSEKKKNKQLKTCKAKKEDVQSKCLKPSALHISPKAMRKAQKQMRIQNGGTMYRSSRAELNQLR